MDLVKNALLYGLFHKKAKNHPTKTKKIRQDEPAVLQNLPKSRRIKHIVDKF